MADNDNNNNNNTTETPVEEVDPFKKAIAEQVAAISGLSLEQILDSVEDQKSASKSDLAIPVPKLNKFRKLEGKPNEIAAQWATQFKCNDLISECFAGGPYLNFKVNKLVMARKILKSVIEQKEQYGSTTQGNGQTAIVEFSSPNIAKPFHAGHLRSTIIGNFIRNLHKHLGYNVVGINYLGDWGKQYGLLAIGFDRYGSEEELQKDPIKHLFDVYVKINGDKEQEKGAGVTKIDDDARAYFKKMEEGDEAALALWRKFRDLSITEYKKMYARLNVEFDEYSGESFFGEKMVEQLKKLEEMHLLEEDKGAKIANMEADKLGKVIVVKKDGSTLYITRDIAAATARKEKYHFTKMIYVVAAQQNLHFQQLFCLLGKMNYPWVKDCSHVNFGMVKGMSTRRGNVVFLQDILEEAKNTMLDVMKKNEKKFAEIEDPEATADTIGISAVLIQDLSARRIKDYGFDWARMTSFEGDTGPYLQFSHTRLCSMERKAGDQGIPVNFDADISLLTEKEGFDLISIVGKFPGVLQNALQQLEPCIIVQYLMSLSHGISLCLEKIRVLGQNIPQPVAEARLLMYWSARITLGSGLRILGLKPLERM
jgi:arginyl-tRNA synthetase